MSPRRTLFTALVLAVAIALVVADRALVERRALVRFQERTVLEMGADDITGMELNNPFGHVALERRGEQWWITEPVEERANQERIRIIISNLADAKRHSAQAGISHERLSDYGLDQPVIRATFKDRDGSSRTLLIGSPATAFNQVFATIEGTDEVFTVSQHIRSNLTPSLRDLRDLRIFHEPFSPVKSIAVVTAAGAVSAEQASDGRWLLANPAGEEADPLVIREITQRVNDLRAVDIVELATGDRKKTGLEPPRITLTLTRPDGAQRVLKIGNPRDASGDEFYAQVPERPQIYTISKHFVDALPVAAKDLLNRQLMRIPLGEVAEVTVTLMLTTRGQSVSLVRNAKGKWQLRNTPEVELHQDVVNQMLKLFHRLRAQEIVATAPADLDRYGLARPTITVVWRDTEHKKMERLDVGAKKPDSEDLVYMRRGGSQFICAAPSPLVTVLECISKMENRRVMHFDLSEAASVEYKTAAHLIRLERRGREWWLREIDTGREIPLEAKRVEALLEALAALEFKRPVNPAMRESLRQTLHEKAEWTLGVRDAAGRNLGEIRTLRLPADVESNQMTVQINDGPVFWIATSDMQAIQRQVERIVR